MKNQIFFAFQIGHVEIGKVTKGVIWMEAILRVLELIFGRRGFEYPPASQIGLIDKKCEINFKYFPISI